MKTSRTNPIEPIGTLINQARTLAKQEDGRSLSQAVAIYTKLIEDHHSSRSYKSRAELHMRLKQYGKAVEDYLLYFTAHPDDKDNDNKIAIQNSCATLLHEFDACLAYMERHTNLDNVFEKFLQFVDERLPIFYQMLLSPFVDQEQIQKIRKQSTRRELLVIRYYIEKSNYKYAESLCKKILKEAEKYPQLYHSLGQIYWNTKKFEDAVKICKEGLRNTDRHPLLLNDLALYYIRVEKNADVVEKLFAECLAKTSDEYLKAIVLCNRTNFYIDQHKLEEAVADIAQLHSLKKIDSVEKEYNGVKDRLTIAIRKRLSQHIAVKQMDLIKQNANLLYSVDAESFEKFACKISSEAIERNLKSPQDVEGTLSSLRVYFATLQHSASEQKKQFQEICLQQGNKCFDAAKYSYAAQFYNLYLQSQPDTKDEQILLRFARALIHTKQTEKAVPVLEACITYHFTSAMAHNDLAVALKELGKASEVRIEGHYLTAISHNPDFVEAHFNLGNFYKETKPELALKHYYQAYSIHSADREALEECREILKTSMAVSFSKINPTLAEKIFADLGKYYTDDADIYFNCGLINSQMGNREIALGYFQKAAALAPDDQEIKEYIKECKPVAAVSQIAVNQVVAVPPVKWVKSYATHWQPPQQNREQERSEEKTGAMKHSWRR